MNPQGDGHQLLPKQSRLPNFATPPISYKTHWDCKMVREKGERCSFQDLSVHLSFLLMSAPPANSKIAALIYLLIIVSPPFIYCTVYLLETYVLGSRPTPL